MRKCEKEIDNRLSQNNDPLQTHYFATVGPRLKELRGLPWRAFPVIYRISAARQRANSRRSPLEFKPSITTGENE